MQYSCRAVSAEAAFLLCRHLPVPLIRHINLSFVYSKKTTLISRQI